ncbi:MAG: 30S ribosomal protein S17e [Candidatus Diapherotrites archaeon]|nr:30S ribosomal protein S17e [Candidatus Diapherotrites archaeon]
MGKAVPRRIKMISAELLERYKDKFVKENFDANKRVVDSLDLPFDKTTRNLVAGFITRTVSAAESK